MDEPVVYLTALDCDWDRQEPSSELLRAALELTAASQLPTDPDPDHGQARLTYTDWVGEIRWLSFHPDGRLAYSRFEDDTIGGHRKQATVDEALALFMLFVGRRFTELDAMTWCEGDGWQGTPAWHDQQRRKAIAGERALYDGGGVERPGIPCAQEGCPRGAVRGGVLCRPHQYEAKYDKPCPFDH